MTGETPLVSVCVLSWNTREVLRRNLQSLFLDEPGPSMEVIVCDNASEDGSADMVAAEFPQVRLLRQSENLMFARGMNAAARVARGRYLLFLNSDCFITPTTLAKMIQFMEDNPDAALCAPRQVRGDGSVEASVQLVPGLPWALRRLFFLPTGWSRRRLLEGDHGRPLVAPMLMGSCLLARRAPIERLGLFDEGFTLGVEDSDLCYRARQAGYGVWFLPQCEVTHLHAQSRSQLPRTKRQRHMVAGAVRFCHKHYSRSYCRAVAAVEALLLARDLVIGSVVVFLTLGLHRKARAKWAARLDRRAIVSGLWRA